MFLPIGEETVTGRIFAELEVNTRIDEGSVSTTERFAGDLEGILPPSEFAKPRLSINETFDEDEKRGIIDAG